MNKQYFQRHFVNFVSVVFAFIPGAGHCDSFIQEWKNNDFFAENSGYSKIIKEGTSMHPQAVEQLLPIITEWAGSRPERECLLLDLACGTETPVASYFIAQYLAKYNIKCNYTGVDINESLNTSRFCFPENVISQTLLTQNAYQGNFLKDRQEKFSIIYSGLNMHHLNPREFVKAVRDYQSLLESDGIFIVFDLFKPSACAYVPKPLYRQMIDPELLSDIPEIEYQTDSNGQDWRENFIEIYTEYANSKNMEKDTIQQVEIHIRENDYPMSIEDAANLLKENGYVVEEQNIYHFDKFYSQIPVSPFFGIIVARPENK